MPNRTEKQTWAKFLFRWSWAWSGWACSRQTPELLSIQHTNKINPRPHLKSWIPSVYGEGVSKVRPPWSTAKFQENGLPKERADHKNEEYKRKTARDKCSSWSTPAEVSKNRLAKAFAHIRLEVSFTQQGLPTPTKLMDKKYSPALKKTLIRLTKFIWRGRKSNFFRATDKDFRNPRLVQGKGGHKADITTL